MKNKKQRFKFGVLAFSIVLFNLTFSFGINFKLNRDDLKLQGSLEKVFSENVMNVHFADNGNDFGGFLYFSNGSGGVVDENGEFWVGTTDDSNYECRLQMKGFYYNAERGERLWPLDKGTRDAWGLSGSLLMSGGIYTSCAASGYSIALQQCESNDDSNYNECVAAVKLIYKADGYGYYGRLIHEYSGHKFNLIAGVGYTGIFTQGFVSIESGSKLNSTFVRINNKYPVGFIYDYNGGVGLAGCRFDNNLTGGSMKNLIGQIKDEDNNYDLLKAFKLNSTGDDIEYSGSLGINCGTISTEDTLVKIIIEGVVGMDDIGNTKFGGLGNASDTKMQYFGTKSVSNSALMNYVAKQAELLCRGKWLSQFPISNPSGDVICILGGDGVTLASIYTSRAKYWGKTLIIKQGNAVIKPATGTGDEYYDICLLSGNLVINETGAKNFVFNTGGFVSTTSVSDFSGNVASAEDNYNSGDAVVGSFIRGNFIVNGYVTGNNISEPLKNKYFIYGKFTTNDTISRLESVFSWRCKDGKGSDGNFCPKFKGNPYWNAALVVIDQNYSSPLLGS